MPQACPPRLWGISQDCPPKATRYLQLRLSPKILWSISSFLSSFHHSSQHSEQVAVTQHVRAPSSFGTAHPQPSSLAAGSSELCNNIPFIFPSPWRGLGAESRAQTVSLAPRECWHCDIWESWHILPTRGSTGAQHGARSRDVG